MKNGEKSIDLTGRRLIAMRDVQDALAAGATSIVTAANCVVTPSARDFLQQHGIELVGERGGCAVSIRLGARPMALPHFRSLQPGAGESPPLYNARSRSHQERNLRRRPQALDAPVCRRQRRQHLLSHRPQRSALHADPGEQIRPRRPRTFALPISKAIRSPAASRAPASCCCTLKSTKPSPRPKPFSTAIRLMPRPTPSPAACRPTW